MASPLRTFATLPNGHQNNICRSIYCKMSSRHAPPHSLTLSPSPRSDTRQTAQCAEQRQSVRSRTTCDNAAWREPSQKNEKPGRVCWGGGGVSDAQPVPHNRTHQPTYPPTYPTTHPTTRPTNQPSNNSSHPFTLPANKSTHQPANQPAIYQSNLPVTKSTIQQINLPATKSTNYIQQINLSAGRPICSSTDQSTRQQNEPTIQQTHLPTNQPTNPQHKSTNQDVYQPTKNSTIGHLCKT